MQVKVMAGVLTALIALNMSAGTAIAEDTIKIGLVLPLTGPFTGTGKQILSGAQLYLERTAIGSRGKRSNWWSGMAETRRIKPSG